MFQGAFFIRPDSRAPRYFLKRLESERLPRGEGRLDRVASEGKRMKRLGIVGRVANYVAIVNGMWKIVPYGFIVHIYPGFCRTVYNRKLIFPSIFRQLFRIIANGISKGFPRWRVPARLSCGLSISGPCYLPLDTHSFRISLYLLLSRFLFLENYRFVVSV